MLLVDTLVVDYPVLVHGVVASDHELLELHLQVIIKKHQHEINSGNSRLYLFFLEVIDIV